MNFRKALWRLGVGVALTGAALFATLGSSPPGFRVYPSLEPYDDVALPPDYQEKTEWIFARLMYPEHPRGLDADRELPRMGSSYPGGGAYVGFVYNVGYTRAMLQAALT